MEYIALDVHKHYTWARVESPQGERLYREPVGPQPWDDQEFCSPLERRTSGSSRDGRKLVLGGR